MATQTDVRVMVPRVRRALEGAGAPEVLTDDAIKDTVADALAEVILYTGGVFGKDLVVTDSDGTTGAPIEYATSDALTLPEQSVIAAQAALDYFFHQFANLKVSESIADEAQTWDYTLSANLIRDQLKMLIDQRDRALDRVSEQHALDSYVSFIHVRDLHTSQLIEPWTETGGGTSLVSGQEIDPRFGTVG